MNTVSKNAVTEMRRAFDATMVDFLVTPAIRAIQESRFTVAMYKSTLREIYHYTKENPQLQAYASTYLRGSDREMVKPFLRHAISEVGHEQLALDDLKTLGEDITGIENSQPLPATIAFTGFGFYQITFGNAVSYLGYLYFLEFLPTQHGALFRDAITGAGASGAALTFLRDHMTVDVGHNQLMEKYLARLIHNQADMDAVIYSMRVTANLYAKMLQEAFDRAERPCDFGIAWAEIARQKQEA